MTLSLYPLKFKPLYKEKPWGGQKLKEVLGRDIPPHRRIGESWEISDRGQDSTPVLNGEYSGKTLHFLIQQLQNRLLGDSVWKKNARRFPLLYKILDAEALLSLQVHPPDEHAGGGGDEEGKTEMWYVLQADPGAGVICGLSEGIDRKKFEDLLGSHRIESALRQFPVREGDSIFIPPGRVHTVIPSCLLVEIQKNSDTTYRISDWGRTGLNGKPRQLHLKKALEVIDFSDRESGRIEPLSEKRGKNEIQLLVAAPEFTVMLLKLEEDYEDECSGEHFTVLTGLSGSGRITARGPGGWEATIEPGEFLMLPAYLGSYRIEVRGDLRLLKSYTC